MRSYGFLLDIPEHPAAVIRFYGSLTDAFLEAGAHEVSCSKCELYTLEGKEARRRDVSSRFASLVVRMADWAAEELRCLEDVGASEVKALLDARVQYQGGRSSGAYGHASWDDYGRKVREWGVGKKDDAAFLYELIALSFSPSGLVTVAAKMAKQLQDLGRRHELEKELQAAFLG